MSSQFANLENIQLLQNFHIFLFLRNLRKFLNKNKQNTTFYVIMNTVAGYLDTGQTNGYNPLLHHDSNKFRSSEFVANIVF